MREGTEIVNIARFQFGREGWLTDGVARSVRGSSEISLVFRRTAGHGHGVIVIIT
jgi:hypothetical protein